MEMRRVEAALEAGADCIVVDIAHGDSHLEIEMIKNIRKHFPEAQIIGGNVATADGTKRLIDAGADSVKVGVGPGSICITRQVAGSGVPQLTAVIECAKAAGEYGIPIIADGGIRQPGDLAKAIAAGAQTAMIGSMLAGTDESPGLVMTRRGHRYKASRGMASREANIDRNKREGNDLTQEEIEEYVAEGVEAAVPYRGKAREVLTQLVGGLQSGMSYSGAHFDRRVSAEGDLCADDGRRAEGVGPHDVEVWVHPQPFPDSGKGVVLEKLDEGFMKISTSFLKSWKMRIARSFEAQSEEFWQLRESKSTSLKFN